MCHYRPIALFTVVFKSKHACMHAVSWGTVQNVVAKVTSIPVITIIGTAAIDAAPQTVRIRNR